jgi:ferredoxin-thioredoxin reductase catalytic subunit
MIAATTANRSAFSHRPDVTMTAPLVTATANARSKIQRPACPGDTI